MKTVSIKELHEATGRIVREARENLVVVTDRGARIAVIKPYAAKELPGRPFPRRRASALPSVGIDSTAIISGDRDER